MTKRPLIKDDDEINAKIKKQVPNNNSSTTAASPKTQLLFPSLPQLQHNGKTAATLLLQSQEQGKELKDRVFTDQEKVKDYIPPCKSCHTNQHVIEEKRQGAYVCTRCGEQAGTVIIEGADWRDFDDTKGSNNRVTAEDRMGAAHSVRDANLKKTPEQRRLMKVRSELDLLRNVLQFNNNLFHTAYELAQEYLLAGEEAIGKNINTENLAAVCLYASSLHHHTPIDESKIITLSRITEKAFNKQRKRLEEVRKLTNQAKKSQATASFSDPKQLVLDLVANYCKKLQLSSIYSNAAKATIYTAMQTTNRLTTKSPNVVASGVILFIATLGNKHINRHELQSCSHANLSTIREAAKLLYSMREQIVPEGFVDATRLADMSLDEFT